MKCIECPKMIHPERMAASPMAKTCSLTCSVNRKRRMQNEASARYYQRKREKRQRDKRKQ